MQHKQQEKEWVCMEKKIHSKQKVNEVLVLYRETCEEVILRLLLFILKNHQAYYVLLFKTSFTE